MTPEPATYPGYRFPAEVILNHRRRAVRTPNVNRPFCNGLSAVNPLER